MNIKILSNNGQKEIYYKEKEEGKNYEFYLQEVTLPVFSEGSLQKGLILHFFSLECASSEGIFSLKKLCKFYLAGTCTKSQCPFLHDTLSYPCKFFHVLGKCELGPYCRFGHFNIDKDTFNEFMLDNKEYIKQMYQSKQINIQLMNPLVLKFIKKEVVEEKKQSLIPQYSRKELQEKVMDLIEFVFSRKEKEKQREMQVQEVKGYKQAQSVEVQREEKTLADIMYSWMFN